MIDAQASVDSSARVDPDAVIEAGASIGPYSIVGPRVTIGADTQVGSHVVINGPTRIGRGNRIYQFSSIGDDPQDKKYAGEQTELEIGDRNIIREYCTLNRGTDAGGGLTRIGDDNWIMAYVHVAHDCVVGNDIIMANGATLAGHVTVDDHVTFGAFTVVHQFCAIGAHAFSAMGTVVLQDVPPYVTVAGNPAAARGINAEGLKRRGFSPSTVREIRRAYKTLYKQGLGLAEATALLSERCAEVGDLQRLVDFLSRTGRGIVR